MSMLFRMKAMTSKRNGLFLLFEPARSLERAETESKHRCCDKDSNLTPTNTNKTDHSSLTSVIDQLQVDTNSNPHMKTSVPRFTKSLTRPSTFSSTSISSRCPETFLFAKNSTRTRRKNEVTTKTSFSLETKFKCDFSTEVQWTKKQPQISNALQLEEINTMLDRLSDNLQKTNTPPTVILPIDLALPSLDDCCLQKKNRPLLPRSTRSHLRKKRKPTDLSIPSLDNFPLNETKKKLLRPRTENYHAQQKVMTTNLFLPSLQESTLMKKSRILRPKLQSYFQDARDKVVAPHATPTVSACQ